MSLSAYCEIWGSTGKPCERRDCGICQAHRREVQKLAAIAAGDEGAKSPHWLPKMDTKPTNPKDALGILKPPMSTVSMPFTFAVLAEVRKLGLMPAHAVPFLYGVGLAMLEGACKYARHNYRAAGVRASVYVDASWRHGSSHLRGEGIDPDSGLPHLVKFGACLAVIYDSIVKGNWVDDRPPKITWPCAQLEGDVEQALRCLGIWWEGGNHTLLKHAAAHLAKAYGCPEGWQAAAAEHTQALLKKYEGKIPAPWTQARIDAGETA